MRATAPASTDTSSAQLASQIRQKVCFFKDSTFIQQLT
jgi:hypothetical protein